MALVFDLDQQLILRHWFTAQRAGLSASRRAEGAVWLAARQFSAPNRFTGFLSQERLVRHDGFLVIGPNGESRQIHAASRRRCGDPMDGAGRLTDARYLRLAFIRNFRNIRASKADARKPDPSKPPALCVFPMSLRIDDVLADETPEGRVILSR